jgi:hypothetical protein
MSIVDRFKRAFNTPDEDIQAFSEPDEDWDPVTGVDLSPKDLTWLLWYGLAIAILGFIFAAVRSLSPW